jgi:hypothetical protein
MKLFSFFRSRTEREGEMLKNAIIVCALLLASTAFGADGPVTIKGCTSSGVEGCLFITSPQGNYPLFVKPPRPDPGRGISVTGTISNDPNICMAGPGIKVSTWSYSDQQCP